MRQRAVVVVSLSLFLMACGTTQVQTGQVQTASAEKDPIKTVRIDHSAEIKKEFDYCRAQALDMDSSAKLQGSAAQYHTAARLFAGCVRRFSEYHEQIPAESMMVLQALAILDFLKAGDLQQARDQLHLMQSAFPHYDLYLENGDSFVDSMIILLDIPAREVTVSGLRNVNPALTAEQRRLRYWLQH
ncbi:MAG: hypothetical protein SV765_08975 [Pseudomonadota bacterium]|nr:hypothetical protein [Pseudomonadota bacterium]